MRESLAWMALNQTQKWSRVVLQGPNKEMSEHALDSTSKPLITKPSTKNHDQRTKARIVPKRSENIMLSDT